MGGGIAWGLCFGRSALIIAPWIALVPLFLILGRRRAPLWASCHGIAYWLTSVAWIAPTLETYGQLPGWLAAAALALLCIYLGAFHGLFGWLGSAVWGRGGWRAIFGLPALWVALEWLRAHLLSGSPWNLAGYAWIEVGGALPVAAWIGVFGVSYLVLMVNSAIAFSLEHRTWRPGVACVLISLLVLTIASRWSDAEATRELEPTRNAVRLLQPNIPNLMDWNAEDIRDNYERVVGLSRDACDRPDALVVWPESAGWPFVYGRDPVLSRDLEVLVSLGCPILFNSVTESGGRHFNSVLLITEEGIIGRYDKRHLVPFGEYVPLARWLPFVSKLARNAGDFIPGEELALLPWQGEQLGAAICFEIVFPFEVAEMVRRGASLLVTVTNDAWYGDSAAPWQHFRAARFRAAETRRYLLRAAITGVSGLVAPDGSVISALGVGQEGIIRGIVAGRKDLTPFVRMPWLVPLLCSLAAGSVIFRRRGR